VDRNTQKTTSEMVMMMMMASSLLKPSLGLNAVKRLAARSRCCPAAAGVFLLPPPTEGAVVGVSLRQFSSNPQGGGGGGGYGSSGDGGRKQNQPTKSFRPRRRSLANYRPIKAAAAGGGRKKKKKEWMPGNDQKFATLGQVKNPRDELEAAYGPLAARVICQMRKDNRIRATGVLEGNEYDFHEEELRAIDYWTAERGSTEELVFERRAFEQDTEQERQAFLANLQQELKDADKYDLDIDNDVYKVFKKNPLAEKEELNLLFEGARSLEDRLEDIDNEDEEPELVFEKNQLAHGEWSEMMVDVRRGNKLWRGGRIESFRALVIGGNCNGCAGFGIGKAPDPMKAVELAGRNTKRNIFFVDRYQGDGLTRDLVGTMNSCKVIIRATDNGLRGNELCQEILMRFGITNAVCKAYGNRHPWNVVRATFKALLTHESLEDIALKRGKRIVSIERAMRMQI
jgi:small subunit ribosomal protein S5